MIELHQAEWCPYSRQVRSRLTILGVDFVARQVAADADRRGELEERTGSRAIPVLVLDDATVISGTDPILAYLDTTYSETAESKPHRLKQREHQ